MSINELVWELMGGFVQDAAHDEIREIWESSAVNISELNALMNDHCEDAECLTCGERCCPWSEPLHFHHDGCPACHME